MRAEAARRFGRNLFMARRRAGYSQEELATLCALHRTEIGYVENGRRLPRVDTLVKLVAALEVKADDLLAGIDWTAPRAESPRQPLRRGGGLMTPRGDDPLRARPSTKVTSLRLPSDLAAELDVLARVDRLPISELVRAAVYQFIAARRSEPEFKERLKRRLEEDHAVLKRMAE